MSEGCAVTEAEAAQGLRHAVFFYDGMADYRAAVSDIVRTGLARKEPVLLAVPQPGPTLPDWPADGSAHVLVTDMADLGRNPARLIPALRTFANRHLGRRARIVSESVWPGRPAAEICEAARAEALVDVALAGMQATLICPYSADLPADALADAARSHQWRLDGGSVVPSPAYAGENPGPAACRVPLPSPPADAHTVKYLKDLRPVRAMVASACEKAGLSAMRTTDLTLAVSELAANTLRHTDAGGTAQAWHVNDEVICQITDSGHITDPLAGVLPPDASQSGGHGLWLVNQVCDLVQIRSDAAGTLIRLHMQIPR